MTEQEKEIDHIEILHLDESGYGPEGEHTRRAWRAECLDKLLAGKEQFKAWQRSWIHKKNNVPSQNYDVEVHYADGSTNVIEFGTRLTLDFAAQVFPKGLHIPQFEFLVQATFYGVQFDQVANFEEVKFEKAVTFSEAKFGSSVTFLETKFGGGVDFSKAKFDIFVLFSEGRFDGLAYFVKTRFENSVFSEATFGGDVYFSKAQFCNDAFFRTVKFSNGAYFDTAEFHKTAEFRCAQLSESTFFQGSVFNGRVSFENAVIDNVGHFEGSSFQKQFPSFRGCQIDSTRLEFSDEQHFPSDDFTEEAIKNISFLKRLSDEHGQTDQALNFNAMELRAKRQYEHEQLKPANHPDAKFEALTHHLSWRTWVRFCSLFKEKRWFCIFTWLYEYTSDFGRSFIRPVVTLLFLNFVTFLICLWFAYEHTPKLDIAASQEAGYANVMVKLNSESDKKDYIPVTGWRAATEYSLYRTGNFLDFSDADKRTEMINQRLFQSDIEPTSMRIYGFFKGLFSAFLLFLFALGLRNKYRVS